MIDIVSSSAPSPSPIMVGFATPASGSSVTGEGVAPGVDTGVAVVLGVDSGVGVEVGVVVGDGLVVGDGETVGGGLGEVVRLNVRALQDCVWFCCARGMLCGTFGATVSSLVE